MAENRCRRGCPVRAGTSENRAATPMEAVEEPMNHYISACSPTKQLTRSCEPSCCTQHNRVLLEQLVELSAGQNQLLVEILGAINSLTAALLTTRAQI